MHHDRRDLVGRERPPRADRPDGVERGVVAADAGIEFERHAHGLESLAEPRGQLGEVELVARAGERGAEAAVRAFEHVGDAGEALLGEQRRIERALRRAARMHALDHGAVLRGHQAGRLGAGNAERMHDLVGGNAQRRGGARDAGEHPDRGAGVPALADVLRPHAQADPRADLVAGDGGAQEVAAAHARAQLGDGDERRQGHRADVQHAGPLHVVELEALHEHAVGKRRVRRAEPLLAAPHAALGRGVDARKRRHQDAAPFESGAEQGAAERVEHEQFQPLDHLARDALVGEAGDEVGDAARIGIVPGRSAHEA